MRTVVIGIGNPILCDDGAGPWVARALGERLRNHDDIDVKELHAGGIRVMESMIGYDRAIIVDAMVTGELEPGGTRELSIDETAISRHIFSTHDTGLSDAMALGRAAGLSLPRDIAIWGIEAANVGEFGETLSPAVTGAANRLIDRLADQLGAKTNRQHGETGDQA